MGKILKTSAEGRKCAFLNCTHILSIYNHTAYCHLHEDKIPQYEQLKISEVARLAIGTHQVKDDFSV